MAVFTVVFNRVSENERIYGGCNFKKLSKEVWFILALDMKLLL